MKGKLITLTALGLALLLALFAFGYAWFANVSTVKKAEFGILQIDSTISLYRAINGNFNGVPETLSSNGQKNDRYKSDSGWETYSVKYYVEKYAFELIGNKYMLSTETTESVFSDITISDVQPSRIYTFKGVIVNYSGRDVTVELKFNAVDNNRVEDFECRLVYATEEVTDSSGETTSTKTYIDDKQAPWESAEYFGEWTTLSESGTTLLNPTWLGWTNDDDKFDFWLQIRMKSDVTETLSESLKLELVSTVTVE